MKQSPAPAGVSQFESTDPTTHTTEPLAGGSVLISPSAEPPAAWGRLAVDFFHERMLSNDSLFPCIFGVDAVRKATLRYAFVPAGPDRVQALAQALTEFTAIAPSLGIRTSLVAFFDFEEDLTSIADYRDHFWSCLAELNELDQAEWPAGIATDPSEPTWEFSFNGMAMFVVANTPFHSDRRSRHSEYFTVTFQPRFVFDDLQAGTPTGDRARAVIRRRLQQYDVVEQTPLLGSFGDPENREWTQYFLADDNSPVDPVAGCPIAHFRDRASS